MRTTVIKRKSKQSRSIQRLYKNYRYYDDNGRGPILRFLYHEPNQVAPTRRVVIFLFLGACLSIVGVQLTADEHLYGPSIANTTDPFGLEVNITFSNLSCLIDGIDQPILRNMRGEIRHGKLTAVLGPSGSGKTTFLLHILGRARKYCARGSEGEVFINGQPGSLESILDWIGFVPQDDVLYSELTVAEAVESSAEWRLPRNMDTAEKQRIINQTLRVLALDAVRDQRIGNADSRGISGGERKRTSVAMELVAKPSVLVMDEPTSGLDSASAFTLVKMLRDIADSGVSVITVLHQPSERIFELLDDLVLMQSGEAAYVGPREEVLPYLASAGYDVPENRTSCVKSSEYILDVLAGLELPSTPESGSSEMCSSLGAHYLEYSRQRWDRLKFASVPHSHTHLEYLLEEAFGIPLCANKDMRFLCRIQRKLAQPEDDHPFFPQRPKPGLRQQVHVWLWDILLRTSLRKGIWQEIQGSWDWLPLWRMTYTGKANTNLFLSLSIGLLGMFGAILNDDIQPVRRAAAAGMLLGAHEFAILAHNLFKGILTSLLYSLVYFFILYSRTGVWVFTPKAEHSSYNFSSCLRLHKFIEFMHIINLNYLASSAIGSSICVFVNHRLSDAYVVVVAVLLTCHVLSFYSPNRNQIKRDTLLFNTYDLSGLVNGVCKLSYVSYFLEAMFLWDPEETDKHGRRYVLRYYGYSQQNKSYCCLCVFSLWTVGQGLRYIVFGLQNSSDFHSVYDTPLFLNFIFKVLACHVVVLIISTVVHEIAFHRSGTPQEAADEASPLVDVVGVGVSSMNGGVE